MWRLRDKGRTLSGVGPGNPAGGCSAGLTAPRYKEQYQDQNTNFTPSCTSLIGFLVVVIEP